MQIVDAVSYTRVKEIRHEDVIIFPEIEWLLKDGGFLQRDNSLH